jgi:hypothetical protein
VMRDGCHRHFDPLRLLWSLWLLWSIRLLRLLRLLRLRFSIFDSVGRLRARSSQFLFPFADLRSGDLLFVDAYARKRVTVRFGNLCVTDHHM